ncbi:MAG: hypothetical protein P8N92_04295, partial [Burkholderiales bacterium]|nr:hypothetical protein [Burkholderiales bacterium]
MCKRFFTVQFDAIITFIIGILVAVAVLNWLFVPGETDFEASSTLGTKAKSLFAKSGEFLIHCSGSRDAHHCIEGQEARGATQGILWLGNSQLHEVNQWKPGDKNAPLLLFNSLSRHQYDLVTFSAGNASLQEQYVTFEYLRRRLPLKTLILSLVFDDMREDGVRSDTANFMDDLGTRRSLSETMIGERLVSAFEAGLKTELITTDNGNYDAGGILQARAENKLNNWLAENSRLWQLRPEIRGWLFIGLYRVRNFVFGITADTPRTIIPGRYRSNLAALEAILDRASSDGIEVIMYVAPLRGGVRIPYVPSQYSAFKRDMESLGRQYGSIFKNFEKLIPDSLWGTKSSTNLGRKEEL